MAKGRRSGSGKNQRRKSGGAPQPDRGARPNGNRPAAQTPASGLPAAQTPASDLPAAQMPGGDPPASDPAAGRAPASDPARRSVAAAEGTAVVTAPIPSPTDTEGSSREAPEEPFIAGTPTGLGRRPDDTRPDDTRPNGTTRPDGSTRSHGTTRSGAPVPPRLLPPLASEPVRPKPELRPPYPRPDSSRRPRMMSLGGPILLAIGLVVVAGALIGLLVSSAGGGPAKRSPITAYLAAHVPAGTRVASFGPLNYSLPAAYPTVPVDAAKLSASVGLRFGLAPDPLISAGPAVTSYVLSHASLVAVDHGHASLWALNNSSTPAASPPAPPASAATPPPPATATPAAPPAPPASAAAPPPPVTAAPPAPPASAAAPAPSTPATRSPTPTPATVTVQPGQNFWSIAQQVEHQRLGTTPTNAQVAHYWTALVAANSSHLPVPGNPNLIYSGTTLSLPAA